MRILAPNLSQGMEIWSICVFRYVLSKLAKCAPQYDTVARSRNLDTALETYRRLGRNMSSSRMDLFLIAVCIDDQPSERWSKKAKQCFSNFVSSAKPEPCGPSKKFT